MINHELMWLYQSKGDETMKKLFAVVTAVVLMTAISSLYALADQANPENRQETIVINNSKGEYVGTLTNVLVDSAGNIGFIVLSIDKEGGLGEKEIAVPLDTFSYDRQKKLLLLDISMEKLSTAPEFKTSDLNDPDFPERIYRFFGLMPFWTTEGEE
jgi:hypothetical protein